MNHTIGLIFKAIPLVIAAICIGLGIYVLSYGENTSRTLPGVVLIGLSSICIALYCTAAVIISQLANRYKPFMTYLFPAIGYSVTVITFFIGVNLFLTAGTTAFYVGGHIVCGLALITGCVSTAATASTRFYLIPVNTKTDVNDNTPPEKAFSKGQASILKAIPVILSLIAWAWALQLVRHSAYPTHFVAGFVMIGLASICTSLISLVFSIVNQVCNSYSLKQKGQWPSLVLVMGSISLLSGLFILLIDRSAYSVAPGFVLIGLGLICYSISSKVILLALTWKSEYALANRIPMIPIFTALVCLFLSAFLFEESTMNEAYFIPARVMVGLGGICFCLFSIVSILESGVSKK